MNFLDCIKSYSAELRIKCESPYQVSFGGQSLEFDAYFPLFGGSRGQLVMRTLGPDFSISSTHVKLAKAMGIQISFLNPESIGTLEEFIDVLRDWGYFGPGETPLFLAGQ